MAFKRHLVVVVLCWPLGLFAQSSEIKEHFDPIEQEKSLSLSDLVQQTLDKYPDRLINEALFQEADAWKERGDSWFAGSHELEISYDSDKVSNNIGNRRGEASLTVTPWNWGQRSAAQSIAERSLNSAEKQSTAIKLEVARLVRLALWDMSLADIRLQQANYNFDISNKLLEKVRRRVELGDLARADLLLAQSEHLQNTALLKQAKAEVMHARKNYTTLTQTTKVPENYKESLSSLQTIEANHPMLEAVNAQVASKQAKIEWAKSTDTINQPKFSLSGTTSRPNRDVNDTQTAMVGVVIPFGHATYDAPEIAAAHRELNQAQAEREHLIRQLEKNLHEAEHSLEVTRHDLGIARELRQIAETHLKMMEISFTAGEINLMDLLKIQARSLEAIRNAREQEVKLERNIALYNQAVGVLP
jgi:outer membrane protein, heavy metal efflux system